MSVSFVRSFFQLCAFNCLIVYFQVYILKVNGDTLQVKPNGTINIECSNSSTIRIETADIEKISSTECLKESCDLNSNELSEIRSRCENNQSCSFNLDFKTPCLLRSKHVNFSFTCKAPDDLQCNFEPHEISPLLHTCFWFQDNGDVADWVPQTGQNTGYIGPTSDHTTGKDFGGYFILKGTNSGATYASLYSSELSSNNTKCLTFWYTCHGATTSLSVTVKKNGFIEIIDSLSSYPAAEWTEANVEINTTGAFSIGIKGFVNDNNATYYVAIDDVDVTVGSCGESKTVKSIDTFEKGFGNWKAQNVSSDLFWSLACQSDHTTNNLKDGHCVVARSNPRTPGILRVRRDFINTKYTEYCLKFWNAVGLQSETDAKVTIFLIHDSQNELIGNVTLKLPKNTLNFWQRLSFSFQTIQNKNYTLTFVVEFKSNTDHTRLVMFDDIVLLAGHCTENKTVIQTCIDTNKPITIEDCPGLYVADDVRIYVEDEQSASHGTNCRTSELETSIHQQCQNSSDYSCTFNLTTDDCFREERYIHINYSCINGSIESTMGNLLPTVTVNLNESNYSETTLEYSISTNHDPQRGIALGIGGAVALLAAIMLIVFLMKRKSRLKRPDKQDKVNLKTNSHITEHNYATPNKINLVKKSQNQNGQASDVYEMTEDGVYDVSNEPRRCKTNTNANIYDHSVENVYDKSGGSVQHETVNAEIYDRTTDNTYDTSGHTFSSAEHDQGIYDLNTNTRDDVPNTDKTYDVSAIVRHSSRNDETYDHFFGQQTEDEYDMTVRA